MVRGDVGAVKAAVDGGQRGGKRRGEVKPATLSRVRTACWRLFHRNQPNRWRSSG